MNEEQVQVALVPTIHLPIIWEQVEHMLAPAVESSNGRCTIDKLFESLISAQKHLWVVFGEDKTITCVAVTAVLNYPSKTMLSIEFLGGSGIEIWAFKLLGVLESFAKDAGCEGLEATARHGFWKWLEKDGFERAYTVFEKRF